MPLTIAAASSLADILPRLAALARLSTPPRFVFAASGTLARQIAAGAPFDVFVAAGEKETDELAKSGAIDPASRAVFAGNRLVTVQNADFNSVIAFNDLAAPGQTYRVAVGNPDTVPAGRYTKQTLLKRGVWTGLLAGHRLVFTASVREAASAAATGNVRLALVFATDARADKRLRVTDAAVPGRDHLPIRYVAAVTKEARDPNAARTFVRFLASAPARTALLGAGFTAPE